MARDELLYKRKVGDGRRLLWRNLTRYREGTSCWWGPCSELRLCRGEMTTTRERYGADGRGRGRLLPTGGQLVDGIHSILRGTEVLSDSSPSLQCSTTEADNFGAVRVLRRSQKVRVCSLSVRSLDSRYIGLLHLDSFPAQLRPTATCSPTIEREKLTAANGLQRCSTGSREAVEVGSSWSTCL